MASYEEAIEYLRANPKVYHAACREIPSLFVSHVFGYKPVRLHIDIQNFLSQNKRCALFVPRNHGKTAQVSIGRVAWEIGRNPLIRVQVTQNIVENSRKTVQAIKDVLESDKFRTIFPNVQPDHEDWGKQSLRVKRDKILRDSTVSAQPIFGKAGARADLLLGDDLEDWSNSIQQEALRQSVKDAWANVWLPTLEPDGREWIVGTPWHIDGLNCCLIREGENGNIPVFIRRCDGTDSSPWPEKFPADVLRDLKQKMGSIAYARAFELRALSGDETVFKEADLIASQATLPRDARGRCRWVSFDLAYSDVEQGLKKQKDEPDYSVAAIGDIHASGHCFMVRVLRERCSYPEFKKRAIAECQRLDVERAYIETNGPQKGIGQDLAQALSAVGISSKCDTLRNKDNYSRASEVQHVVEEHRFHLRCDQSGELYPDMKPMLTEMSQFPVGNKDDTVDAAIRLMSECKVIAHETPETWEYSKVLYADIKRAIEEPEGRDPYDSYRNEGRDDFWERWH